MRIDLLCVYQQVIPSYTICSIHAASCKHLADTRQRSRLRAASAVLMPLWEPWMELCLFCSFHLCSPLYEKGGSQLKLWAFSLIGSTFRYFHLLPAPSLLKKKKSFDAVWITAVDMQDGKWESTDDKRACVCVTACGVWRRIRESNRGKKKVVGEPLHTLVFLCLTGPTLLNTLSVTNLPWWHPWKSWNDPKRDKTTFGFADVTSLVTVAYHAVILFFATVNY